MESAIGKTIRFGVDKMMTVKTEVLLTNNSNFYSQVVLIGKKGREYIGFRRHDGSYRRI